MHFILVSGHVAGHYVYLSAIGAKSLMPVESFVRFPVALTQHLNALHFLLVFFRAGKELKQPRLE
ncbi:MAG TPA: hypothetical protein VFQ41_21910 [Candidatus Angelobacter sp.]|nr:hypothetical protein [Candidatus Angelobacter sp.]